MRVLIFIIAVCVSLSYVAATICKPFSRFEVDCNICRCSADGQKYTCTDFICGLANSKSQFIKDDGEDGYILTNSEAIQQRTKNGDVKEESFVHEEDTNYDDLVDSGNFMKIFKRSGEPKDLADYPDSLNSM